VVKKKPIKLDLSYADRARLLHFPWPWQDGSVEEFQCAEIFQHVPGRKRLQFMEELYRVLALRVVAGSGNALDGSPGRVPKIPLERRPETAGCADEG
jgi:hypothetical protein